MTNSSNIPSNLLAATPRLGIQQIAPRWASRINGLPAPLFSLRGTGWGFQMIFAETCIVGEAYGYSAPYIENCAICREIGYEFVVSFMMRSYGRFHRNLDTFVEHWNEKHTLVTVNKRRFRFGLEMLFKANAILASTV